MTSIKNSDSMFPQITCMKITQLPAADFTAQIGFSPNAPDALLKDGSLNWAPNQAGTSTWNNPFRYIKQPFESKTVNLISNATIRYKITPKLEFKSNFGFTSTWIDEFSQSAPLAAVRPERRNSTIRSGDMNIPSVCKSGLFSFYA